MKLSLSGYIFLVWAIGAVFIGPMIVVDPELATRFNIWACTLLRYIAPNFGIQVGYILVFPLSLDILRTFLSSL